jgi:hypothetical protein
VKHEGTAAAEGEAVTTGLGLGLAVAVGTSAVDGLTSGAGDAGGVDETGGTGWADVDDPLHPDSSAAAARAGTAARSDGEVMVRP